ncbi:MAG: nitronate monooxygenase [Planctomycetota bacterium]|nr:nitronate monooxygenase [Planctomycetota bacterium]MDG2143586.1 nitronate monooxygenase [Planctomycetota bacterium]
MRLPKIIQGGMGAAVSDWRLAKAVSKTGQLGVVSGTALDCVIARRLQVGDIGGHVRRALEAFPVKEIGDRIRERYFVPGGKAPDQPFKAVPMLTLEPVKHHLELIVAANFVEVFLAKEKHDGIVGINYLEKIQLPNLPSIFGAMLAGANCIIMGAGIPRAIPGIMDQLSRGEAVELAINLAEADAGQKISTKFDPRQIFGDDLPEIARPLFLAIVSSAPLASMLARKASGHVDGFIIESPVAGGHNAPPRGALELNANGEPIYGERDLVDMEAMRKIGRPFYLAGGVASPQGLQDSLDVGAVGIQVGTVFAYCEESGLGAPSKARVLARFFDENAEAPVIRTDPRASPTGFPFKVLPLTNTMSHPESEAARPRLCDLGYLREAYNRGEGKIGYRCPSEPVDHFLKKGGADERTKGRLCVCNGLMATIELGQTRKDGYREDPLITSGDGLEGIRQFLKEGAKAYSAADVVAGLLAEQPRGCHTGEVKSASELAGA